MHLFKCYAILWILIKCLSKWLFCLKWASQCWHLNGFSPVWDLKWTITLYFCFMIFEQMGHWKLSGPSLMGSICKKHEMSFTIWRQKQSISTMDSNVLFHKDHTHQCSCIKPKFLQLIWIGTNKVFFIFIIVNIYKACHDWCNFSDFGIKCIFSKCLWRLLLRVKFDGHNLQLKGFTPVCVKMCCSMWSRFFIVLVQNGQAYSFAPSFMGFGPSCNKKTKSSCEDPNP